MEHVTVEPVPESRLVRVGVTQPDPAEAARWANALADVYIEQSVAGGVESARKAHEWLQERLAATQQEMREAQDRLFKSYQTQDLFVPEGSQSAVTTSITRLNEDQVAAAGAAHRARGRAAADRRRCRRAGRAWRRCPRWRRTSSTVGISGQLAALRPRAHAAAGEVQARPSRRAEGRGPGRAAREGARRAGARRSCAGCAPSWRSSSGGRRRPAAPSRRRRRRRRSQSRKGAELDALRKEAESAKNLYEVLLQKLNESNIAASIAQQQRDHRRARHRPRVAGAAGQASGSPASPPCSACSSASALLLGRDYFDNTLKDAEEVERYLHLDVLASVPRYGEDTGHLVTEAYQNLRTALLFARRDDGGQVVLVTGTAPQEGKTTTLVNVAKLLAASGERTLVVDCDLRRAQLHTWLGLDREPGLTDHFVSHLDLATLIRPTLAPNLFALTAGPLPPNPPALLARRDMARLLDRFARRVRVGAGGLAAAGVGDRRAAARTPRRHRALRGPAQQGGQEAGEARAGQPAAGRRPACSASSSTRWS